MKPIDLRQNLTPSRPWLGVVLVAIALLALAPAAAQQRGRCATTELPGHLILPDGKIADAGSRLTLCYLGEPVPGRGEYELRIDHRAWGRLYSRVGHSDDDDERGTPLFVFSARSLQQRVRLLGVAWPEAAGMTIHVLTKPGCEPTAEIADASRLLSRAREESLIVVEETAPSRRH